MSGRARIPPGTRVRHDRWGEGIVRLPSRYTHPSYELVELDAGGYHLRLRRSRLTPIQGNTEPEAATEE